MEWDLGSTVIVLKIIFSEHISARREFFKIYTVITKS